jgi:hypothetical protein
LPHQEEGIETLHSDEARDEYAVSKLEYTTISSDLQSMKLHTLGCIGLKANAFSVKRPCVLVLRTT